jgi:hypothetical protein
MICNRFQDIAVLPKEDGNIFQFIKPDMVDGPWIAGGAVLSWINKESVGNGDVDIFCRTPEQVDKISGLLFDYYRCAFNSDNAVSYDLECHRDNFSTELPKRVQVIKRFLSPSPEHIIDNFDISVCKLVTDGKIILSGDNALDDIKHNILRIEDAHHPVLLKRVLKYMAYGYELCEASAEIMRNNEYELTFENDLGDYAFPSI